VELKIPDLQVGLCGDSSDAVCRGTLVCPFQDTIHVDHPARPDRRERVREVVKRRMREVQDDAVDRCDLVQDSAGVAFMRRDSVHAVGPDVRAEQLDRRRVPDAAGRERRLAAHGRVGVVEPVAQQRPVEAPGVGGGEQAGEGTDQRFVHLLRGRARRRQPYKKKEGGATGVPGPAPSEDAHTRAPECGWGCAGGRGR